MIIGETIQLEATVLPNNATDKTIIWNSSDNKVASVNGQGLVTAIAEGENSITATTNDGEKVASCKIKIRGKGVEISKPKISDITSISASVTGTLKAFGIKVQESGICYSISQSPTIDDKKIVLSGNEIAYTLTELKSAQTYYVHIYAIVEGRVHYGEEGTFSTTGLIETHFQPTDIYVDKVSLVSPGISGAKSINVCYGKFPNPKVTDNIATATTGSDGKLHLNLTGLEKGTNYYIRVYYRNGSNIKYYDDEASVQTTGKDFQIERKMNKYEEYDYYDPAGYRHTL